MKTLSLCLTLLVVFSAVGWGQLGPNGATASFRGSLPPPPTADLDVEQEAALQAELAEVRRDFVRVAGHPLAADAEIFLKAVRYALEFHEWYDKKPEDGVAKARALLAEARSRIDGLRRGQITWAGGSGWKVLGFRSRIDGSAQPYAVEIPPGLTVPGPMQVPMWIWLHGRGDTATDLHFLHGKLTARKPGQFQPAGTIVLHPFGRYCNGYKSAGETDVFEARDAAVARFHADPDRIALAGFSMGGAGAWHLGAHYADQWACVHAGAGFVDVKRYQKLAPEKYPPWYEQKLWGVYDVPAAARNFLNVPLVIYSGELDPQRDAAEYMTGILAGEGLRPPHLIGAGMGHKYHPEMLKEVQRLIEEAVDKGRDPWPRQVHLQTASPWHRHLFWVHIEQFAEPWKEARVDAEISDADKTIQVKTRNVAKVRIDRNEATRGYRLVVDGKEQADGESVKGTGNTTGPIDAAFRERFVVVLPERAGMNPEVDEWVRLESSRFLKRWRSLMRGEAIVMEPSELTPETPGTRVLWGDPLSNPAIAAVADQLAVAWGDGEIRIAGKVYPASRHVPLLIQAMPDGSRVVLNSGLTFREAHDRSNSLQNPKLPDWAILDISVPPGAETAGRVVAADFFP